MEGPTQTNSPIPVGHHTALIVLAMLWAAVGSVPVADARHEPEPIEIWEIEPLPADRTVSPNVAGDHDTVGRLPGTPLPAVRCGDFFIVPTTIDDRGPFWMVLDTGASITGLTPGAIERIDPGRHLRAVEIGTYRVTGRIRYQSHNLDAVERVLGHPIDGILGHQVFRPVLLTYDYPSGEVRYRSGTLGDDEPGVAPMSTSKRPFIGALVGDEKINVLLDTGFSGALALEEFDAYTFAAEPVGIGAILRVDGAYLARAARLRDSVTFGPFVMETPIVRTSQGDSLLGQRVLRDFVLTLDQRRGRVQMVRPDGTEQDEPIQIPPLVATGIAVVPTAAGLRVVRVDPGTAAGDAGHVVGDVITHVDGRSVLDQSCRERTEVRVPGETETHTVRRGGDVIEITIEHRVLVR